MLPKALKSCPKSKKSPNLVTLAAAPAKVMKVVELVRAEEGSADLDKTLSRSPDTKTFENHFVPTLNPGTYIHSPSSR